VRVLIAGADGTIGKALLRRLVAAGHEVVGLTRSAAAQNAVAALGAQSVVAEALDWQPLAAPVSETRAETVITC
jgi:nucleoside-diphosphate-sugar epimerase